MRTYSHNSPMPPHSAARRPPRREFFWLVAAGAALAVLGNCAKPPPPFVPICYEDVRIVHCFDGVPHQPGSKPWIMGGTCCCTPSDELIEAYHRDGICLDMTTDDLIELYEQKGVRLALDHTNCNNLCEHGPHVTKGGHCMVPPTPGTRNYEEVVTGVCWTRPSGSVALAADRTEE